MQTPCDLTTVDPGQDHRKGTSQWTTGADYFPNTRRSIKKHTRDTSGILWSADAQLLFSPSWDFPPNLRVKGLILQGSLPVEVFPVRGRGEGESLLARPSDYWIQICCLLTRKGSGVFCGVVFFVLFCFLLVSTCDLKRHRVPWKRRGSQIRNPRFRQQRKPS